jgi:hypothetical protein
MAVPAETPVTIPVARPTVAFAVALLDHVPPTVTFARLVLPAIHRLLSPVIPAIEVLTVTTAVAIQPPL